MFGLGKKKHDHKGEVRQSEGAAPMAINAAPERALPGRVDLRPDLGPVEDIGDQSAGSAFVVAACVDRILAKKGSATRKISRAFLWYYGRAMSGLGDKNASVQMSNYIAAEIAQGHVSDDLWPFKDENLLVQPPQAVFEKRFVLIDMEWGQPKGQDALKACLADGWPVAFKFSAPKEVFDELGKNGKLDPWGDKPAPVLTDYTVPMLLVGYDDARQVFIARNAWGETWGDKGECVIPFDTLEKCCYPDEFFYVGSQETPKKAMVGASLSSSSASSDVDEEARKKKFADMRQASRNEVQDDLTDAKKAARSSLRDAFESGSKRMADRAAASDKAARDEETDVQKQIDKDRADAEERRRANLAGPPGGNNNGGRNEGGGGNNGGDNR